MTTTWTRTVPGAAFALALTLTIVSCAERREPTAERTGAETPAAAEKPHWDYGPEKGPAAWGSLGPEYVACAEGRSQSPIDIPTASVSTSTTALRGSYGAAALSIDHHEHVTDVIDNGHTIQVNCDGGGSVTVGEDTYALAQYHFHSPSEHTVDGKSFPMEMHMVHKSADGKLAVIGTLIEEGAANPAFDAVWAHLPAEKGQEVRMPDVMVDVDRLLPAERTAYHYSGSLTTPPCSEGVQWMVMRTPIALSAEQIGKFRGIIAGNNRPTQPLNERPVGLAAISSKAPR